MPREEYDVPRRLRLRGLHEGRLTMPDQPKQTRRIFLGTAAIGVAAVLTKLSPLQSLITDEGAMPDLDGATGWLNTAPLSTKALRGKVVLVDIWTYSCINSLRQLPYLKRWAATYGNAGLVVIG